MDSSDQLTVTSGYQSELGALKPFPADETTIVLDGNKTPTTIRKYTTIGNPDSFTLKQEPSLATLNEIQERLGSEQDTFDDLQNTGKLAPVHELFDQLEQGQISARGLHQGFLNLKPIYPDIPEHLNQIELACLFDIGKFVESVKRTFNKLSAQKTPNPISIT